MPFEELTEDQARQLQEEFEFFAEEGKWFSPSAYSIWNLCNIMIIKCTLYIYVLHKLDGTYTKDD